VASSALLTPKNRRRRIAFLVAAMRKLILLSLLAFLLNVAPAAYAESPGWRRAKNAADDIIYAGKDKTFYCGCVYTSDGTNTGSGSVDHEVCGYVPPDTHASRAGRVEWEHVVPASLMPARQFDCWVLGNREKCERDDPRAQAMLFDLHNLAPAIGQVNRLRLNDRYTEIEGDPSGFGACPIQDAKGAFEPPNCLKGDAARIWLYMSFRHGVVISLEERDLFERWMISDPVSPWESQREARIFDYTFVHNPFVHNMTPVAAGACPWE